MDYLYARAASVLRPARRGGKALPPSAGCDALADEPAARTASNHSRVRPVLPELSI